MEAMDSLSDDGHDVHENWHEAGLGEEDGKCLPFI